MDADASLQSVVSRTSEGVSLKLKVVPGASRTRIVGVLGKRLKLAVAAPPQGGQANIAMCQLLAQTLDIPIRQVRITAGAGNPNKTVELVGIDAETAIDRIRGVVKA